jgi:hypothetical protein
MKRAAFTATARPFANRLVSQGMVTDVIFDGGLSTPAESTLVT